MRYLPVKTYKLQTQGRGFNHIYREKATKITKAPAFAGALNIIEGFILVRAIKEGDVALFYITPN